MIHLQFPYGRSHQSIDLPRERVQAVYLKVLLMHWIHLYSYPILLKKMDIFI